MFKTIVVATDGSPYGDAAVDCARSMLGFGVTDVVLVHVIELVGGKGGIVPLAADEDELRAKISRQVEQLKADGVHAEEVVLEVRLGGPAHVISDVAASVNADLIVVGSRGHSALLGALLGSVPARLIQMAHRPVLVVPTPAAVG
jgi:nucleotide-binding universal stress UspA family protein